MSSVKNTTILSNSRVQSNTRVRFLTTTALFAAMITIMTAYICHIQIGFNGGYVHFGDALIYLAAVLLPTPYALAAAAIGGGMADFLTAPMWVPATILIKMIITIPFTNKSDKIIAPRNVIATVIAFLLSGTGYYIAEAIIFGTKTAFLMSMTGSCVQSTGSAIIFIVLGVILDKINFKKRVLAQY